MRELPVRAVQLPDVFRGDNKDLAGLDGQVFSNPGKDPAFNVALVTLRACGDYV
jgi:hypothetical protein